MSVVFVGSLGVKTPNAEASIYEFCHAEVGIYLFLWSPWLQFDVFHSCHLYLSIIHAVEINTI